MKKQYGLSAVFFAYLMMLNASLYAIDNPIQACQMLYKLQNISHTSQIVVVQSSGRFKGYMTLCQRLDNQWKPKFPLAFQVVLGKNGIAALGTKREGDLKTPEGLYPIGDAFGMYPLALKMDYKYITKDDKFIDDSHHKLYNTWVSGPTNAKSYEKMLIKPYTYGAIVNYNMNPTQAGHGSAIFIHLWDSPDSGTSGCIAFEKKQVLMLLHWLDKQQHPYILIKA